jgi:hypothetical protein
MHIYFNDLEKMYTCGPYGQNHSTAAVFAFRKELLETTRYDDTLAIAEERAFLKDWKTPLLQLDSTKCILVFAHSHNSVDKKKFIEQPNNSLVKESPKKLQDFVKDPEIIDFLKTLDDKLALYEPGRPENKPEVLRQMKEIKERRERDAYEYQIRQRYEMLFKGVNERIKELTQENEALKEKNEHLNKKLREIVERELQKRAK